jgi:hypothetical protein
VSRGDEDGGRRRNRSEGGDRRGERGRWRERGKEGEAQPAARWKLAEDRSMEAGGGLRGPGGSSMETGRGPALARWHASLLRAPLLRAPCLGGAPTVAVHRDRPLGRGRRRGWGSSVARSRKHSGGSERCGGGCGGGCERHVGCWQAGRGERRVGGRAGRVGADRTWWRRIE